MRAVCGCAVGWLSRSAASKLQVVVSGFLWQFGGLRRHPSLLAYAFTPAQVPMRVSISRAAEYRDIERREPCRGHLLPHILVG